ncbi:hypothetical protein JCM10450v2_005836 [Rhodotorula kratochvilovae]
MTRRSHKPSSRRRTVSTVPPSETRSSASTSSHAQADAETATSSSAAVGIPAADLPECKTLGGGRISREVWLLNLARAVPPPPRTTLEQDTRDSIMEPLALVNKVWRAEILRRKARSALLYIDVPLIRSDLWFLDRWVKQRHDLGAKYADGVRSLVLLNAEALPGDLIEKFVRPFGRLSSLVIQGARKTAEVLTGSATLVQLTLSGPREPAFSGEYPRLERLVLRATSGTSLPRTLTHTNFASLKTLVLDLHKPRDGSTPHEYTAGAPPPPVENLSITCGTDLPFFPSLLGSPNLKQLHLCLPLESLAPALSAVTTSLQKLTLTANTFVSTDKDLRNRPDDAECAIRDALPAPCLVRLKVLETSGPGRTGVKWCFGLFRERLKAQLASQGARLKVVWISRPHFDHYSWGAKSPAA